MNSPKYHSARVYILTGLLFLTLASVTVYLSVRFILFFGSGYPWYEQITAFLLLAAETFILVHCIGYFLNILHVVRRKRDILPSIPPPEPLDSFPPVAIIVSSFREPLEVVEDTLTCFRNLTYPNKHLYFLDDTRYDVADRDPGALES